MLRVEALSKSFNGKKVVDGLSFNVGPGQVLGLLGPNGAGKTTTMGSIAGLLRPDTGEIWICGNSVATSPLKAKMCFGYLGDPPAMLPGSCWDNITFIAQAFGVEDFQPRANALLERFQLTSEKNKKAATLSKGMKQRLGLLLLFLHSPKAIMLDEPTTGLDPAGIFVMNELIGEAVAGGASVVISSHLLGLLEGICDKILVIAQGKEILSGTLSELKAKSSELSKTPSLEEIFLDTLKEKVSG